MKLHGIDRAMAVVVLGAVAVGCSGSDAVASDPVPPPPVAGGDLSRQGVPSDAPLGSNGDQPAVGPADPRLGPPDDGAVWASPDGRSWARIAGGDSIGGPGLQALQGVAWSEGSGSEGSGSEGIGVAVGLAGQDGATGWDAAVWTSSDGLAWTRTQDAGSLGGPRNQSMSGVALNGGSWLAVGSEAGDEHGDSDIASWRSDDDGQTWMRLDAGSDRNRPGSQALLGVAWAGDRWLGVGVDGTDGAVWSSVDGSGWERIDTSGLDGGGRQAVSGVVVVDGVYLAVGRDSQATPDEGASFDAAVWRSDDGATWTRVPLEPEALGGQGEQLMEAAGVNGSQLLAVGRDNGGRYPPDAAVWLSSSDGQSWERQPDSSTADAESRELMSGVAWTGSRWIAVGRGAGE